MLRGTYKVQDYVYYLRGYDFGDNIAFYLSTSTDKARRFIDKGTYTGDERLEDGIEYPASWEEIYISIGKGYIKVSKYTTSEGEKLYANRLNTDFFARLGGIVQGMVSNCNNKTRVDSIDSMLNEFVPKKSIKYKISDKGFVELEMRNLRSLLYRNEESEEELILEDDEKYSERVLKLTNTQHKIKLNLEEFVKRDDVDDDLDWDFSEEDETVFSLAEIIERNPEKSYQWLFGRKYNVVSEIEDVERICKEIWNHDGIVAFDTETTGLDFTFMCRNGAGDRLVGMVFCINPGEAWYFPVAHKKIKNICTPENEEYILNKYFKPILETKPLLCHNGAFDWKVMYVYDICINLVHDTYILPKVTIWNTNRKLELGLKPLTSTFLNRDSFELSDFVAGKWGKSNVKFWDLDEESVKYYACPDTDNSLELYNFFIKEGYLEQFGAKKTYQTEVAFSIVIAYQEFYGHCVNVSKVDELRVAISSTTKKEYEEMVDIVGHDFNPRSNKDLDAVMQELNYPVIKRTSTGMISVGKDVRKALLGQRNPDGTYKYPFVFHLNEYLISAQLESNFTKNIDKFATEDGFMFSKVQQFLETGRVSVKEPNYQSYNDVVKKYIIPRKGYYMMDADYSSIEYRILACMAEQKNLIERFFDPDMDYHTYQASRMFRVPYELVTKSMRSNAKGINFGIPYGMGDPKLGERLFGERTPENTLKAKKMKRIYFEGQENVEKFFIDARANGVKNLYSDTYFGRRRYFDPRVKDKGSIEREAGNNRIQGTAADIYKMAMVKLFTDIRNNGLLGKILISAFVHDECLLEVHKSIDPAKMLKMLRSNMMLKIEGWSPLYIGCGYGTNWYDAKKTEIPVQVQDKISGTWGETGLDWWNGDTDSLFFWEVGLINDYKRDRVINYLKDKENWHKVFKPVENGFAHEVIEEINKGRHVDGVVNTDVHTDKDMIDNLYQFCMAFGIEDLFEKADIQKPNYVDGSQGEVTLDEDEPQETNSISPLVLINARLKVMGVCFGEKEGKQCLYFRYDHNNPALMRIVNNIFRVSPGDLDVYTIVNGEEKKAAGLKVSKDVYNRVLSVYMENMRIKG